MTTIPAALRRLVVQRADRRCEYCGISQAGQVATFHVDHIVPVMAGGETTAENLALACVSCSLRKGARQELVDVETGGVVFIFQSSAAGMERTLCLERGSSCWVNGYRSSNGAGACFESLNDVSNPSRRGITRSSSSIASVCQTSDFELLSVNKQLKSLLNLNEPDYL